MADRSELEVLLYGRDNLSPTLSQLESKLIRFVGAVSSAVAAVKLLTSPAISASNFEREMANVTKTTQFTKSQIDDLGQSLQELSLRLNVSATDLAKIAAAAGQQGLGREGVEGIQIFTESVARMASVLDISVEQAGSDIGKILTIFNISIKKAEEVSSAFNQVSNNSTAEGSQLLDIVKRIGDAGGSLNLQQAIGLAATGLDLGLNPEVIGTSFTKIFSSFRTKSQEFAKLLQIDQKSWIDIVSDNGIKALQLYTDKLRMMDSASQAVAIKQLSGEGRIFNLMQKQVQDTENRTLNKNLGNAEEGFATGTSSLREQATVLNTVNEQVKILGNSLSKLGTDASAPALGELKSTISDLSEGLQSDGVRAFASALFQGFTELFGVIRDGVAWVADLNINWANFIQVAKLFIGMKLAESVLLLAARLPGVASGLQLIARANTQVGEAGVRAAMAEGTAIDVLKAKRAEASAARQAQLLAEREAQIANLRVDTLRSEAAVAQAAIRPLQTAALGINSTASTATAARAAAEQTTQARLEQSTQQHLARMAAIEAQYRGQRRVAQVQARDAEIAAEEAFYARSQRSLQQHGQRRVSIAATAEAEALRIQTESNARILAAQEAFAARSRAIGAAVASANTAGAAATAAAATAQTAAVGVATYAAALGRFILVAGRAVLGMALWVTILYSVADAFGVIDKVKPFFLGLTDAIGLTTSKQAQLQEQTRKSTEEWKKHQREITEVTEAYTKLLDATGRIRPGVIQKQLNDLKDETKPENRQEVISSVLAQTRASYLSAQRAVDTNRTLTDPSASNAAIQEIQKQLEAQRTTRAAAVADRSAAEFGSRRDDYIKAGVTIKNADNAIAQLTKDLAAQQAQLRSDRANSASGIAAGNEARNANLQAENARNAQLVTESSRPLINSLALPLAQARTDLAEVVSQLKSQKVPAGTPGDAAYEEKLRANEREAAVLNDRRAVLQADIDKRQAELRNVIENAPSANERNAAAVVGNISLASPEEIRYFADSVTNAVKDGVKLGDGSNLGEAKPDKPSKGEEGGPPTPKEETEAQKLAKAEARGKIEAAENELKLARVVADGKMQIDQDRYNQGLISIDTYFRNMQAKELADIEGSKRAADARIAALQEQKRQQVKASDRKITDNAIADANADKAVLDKQAENVIQSTKTAIANAKREFTESSNADQQELAKYFGIEEVQDFFNRQFAVYMDQSRVKIAQLKSEMSNAPSDTKGNANKQQQIDNIIDQNRLKAYGETMAEFAKRTSLAEEAYNNFSGNLQVAKLQGLATDQQIINAEIVARNALVSSIGEEIRARLDLLAEATDKNSLAYRQEQAAIDGLILRQRQLSAAADQTAQSINSSVENSLAAALKELQTSSRDNSARDRAKVELDSIQLSMDAQLAANRKVEEQKKAMSVQSIANSNIDAQIAAGNKAIADLQQRASDVRKKNAEDDLNEFVETIRKMASSIASAVLDAFNKNIAQNIVQSVLGGGGNGGIGGFFSSILGGGTGAPKGTANDPLYVTNSAAGTLIDKGLGSLTGDANPIKKVSDSVFGELTTSVGTNLQSFGMFISSAIRTIFASITGSAAGGGLFSSLGGLVTSFFAGGSGGFSNIAPGASMDISQAAMYANVAHTGGIIGGPLEGRTVDPAVFSGAMRYHTGGVIGLKPGERPIIANDGEEMLRADDPRHVNNGGLNTGGTNLSVSVNVDAKGSSVEGDSNSAKALGKLIGTAVQSALVKEQRPGGLLAKKS